MSDEDEIKDMETNIFRKRVSKVSNARDVLQPIRIRRSSVLANSSNWEFMVRECRLVWYSGLLFWSLLILSLAF